jgi:hypothetical protein
MQWLLVRAWGLNVHDRRAVSIEDRRRGYGTQPGPGIGSV